MLWTFIDLIHMLIKIFPPYTHNKNILFTWNNINSFTLALIIALKNILKKNQILNNSFDTDYLCVFFFPLLNYITDII